eukprot:1147168-Pelagomonas_calceolata.AAC.2
MMKNAGPQITLLQGCATTVNGSLYDSRNRLDSQDRLQVLRAACGPAESNGGNRLVDLSPSLPGTLVIRFYQTETCTKPFRRSKSLTTPWRHSLALLASDHPKMTHSSTPGPFFTPRFLCLWPLYTLLTSCIFRKSEEGSQKLIFLAPFLLEGKILQGKWLKFCFSPNTGSFNPNPFAMTFFRTFNHYKKPNSGQWVVEYGDLVAKSRVHAMAN